MTLDITAVRLGKKQEKEILKAAKAQGHISLVLEGKKVRLCADDPGDGATSIDFSNTYYEELIRELGMKRIVPSDELTDELGRIIVEEKAYEDGEYQNAIRKVDGATLEAAAQLKEKIGLELKSGISPKLKNDYRAVLRHLDRPELKADYVEKWAARLLGESAVKEYAGSLQQIKDEFAEDVLRNRLYGRLFLNGTRVEAGRGLRWVRLLRPR